MVTEVLELAVIGCCAYCNVPVVEMDNAQVRTVVKIAHYGLIVEAGDDYCEVAGFHSGPGPVPSPAERREHVRKQVEARGWTAEVEQAAHRKVSLVLDAMGLPVPPVMEAVR